MRSRVALSSISFAIMSALYDFYATPAGPVALYLPPGDSLLLPSERCKTAQPKHTCSKVRLRRRMIEKNSRLAGKLSHIERVLH